jgi:phospholipid/cholesterol/gamma-HCH transport system substrate-binding protein
MNENRFEVELRAGIFVTIGIALICVAIILLGSTENILSRKNHYFVHVTNVEGLIQGAKVVLGGVSVGTVEKIAFDQEKKDIRISLAVIKDASSWIHRDATSELATQGVLGDKFVSINPGTESEPILQVGEEIPILPSKGLNQFLNQGDQLLVTLNQMAVTLNRLLRSFEAGGRSETFFDGITNTAKHMASASEKLDHEMDEVHLKKIIANIQAITDKINNGSGTIGALINDPGLYDRVKALVGEANRNRVLRNFIRQAVKESEKMDEEKAEKDKAQ